MQNDAPFLNPRRDLKELDRRIAPDVLPPNEEAEPIFILGSVRSGTSVMVNAVKKGAGIPGYNEGNIAALMQHLLDKVEEFFRKLAPEYLELTDHHHIGNVDPGALEIYIQNYFMDLYDRYLGKGQWVDKSPDSYLFAPMIRSAPRLLEMFPRAKFVMCIRRGIENVMSRMSKFSHVPFGYQCRSWAHTLEEWYKVKPLLGEERCLEIYQRDIAIDPQKVADDMQAFLGLSDAQNDGMMEVFTGRRYEQTRVAQEHREVPLDETPWAEGYRAAFVKWCHPMMKEAGFTLEGETFESKAPVRLFYPAALEAVRLHNVPEEEGFIKVGDTGMRLRPNAPGQPAAMVRYPSVFLKGQKEFRADITVENKSSDAVQFGFRIETEDSKDRVLAVQHELKGGASERWTAELPDLDGVYDLVISAKMADGAKSSADASATLSNVSLRRAD